MSQARFMNDDALRRAEGVTEAEVSGVTEIRALAASLAGFSYVIFGEGFCSAAFDEGPELFQADIFALAVTRFTTAIAAAEAAQSTELRNLAYVGRARANLKAGNLAQAASDAREVDAGFVFEVTRSGADRDRWNAVYHNNSELQEIQGHPNFWNLEWMGVVDPRPKVNVTGGCFKVGSDSAGGADGEVHLHLEQYRFGWAHRGAPDHCGSGRGPVGGRSNQHASRGSGPSPVREQ